MHLAASGPDSSSPWQWGQARSPVIDPVDRWGVSSRLLRRKPLARGDAKPSQREETNARKSLARLRSLRGEAPGPGLARCPLTPRHVRRRAHDVGCHSSASARAHGDDAPNRPRVHGGRLRCRGYLQGPLRNISTPGDPKPHADPRPILVNRKYTFCIAGTDPDRARPIRVRLLRTASGAAGR